MSPQSCPVCKAQNEHGPTCRRCRADLSLLFQLEDERRRLLDEAGAALKARNWPEVVACARQANALRREEDVTRLVALGSILQHDFAAAWQAYREQEGQPENSL